MRHVLLAWLSVNVATVIYVVCRFGRPTKPPIDYAPPARECHREGQAPGW